MGKVITIAAIEAVIGGNEVKFPATPVELRDSNTGYDGPGPYSIQLAHGVLTLRRYIVTFGFPPPSDSDQLMTVHRVVVTPTGDLVFHDARKVNVGMTGVNSTIMQNANGDGSYIADGQITERTLGDDVQALLQTIPYGTTLPTSPKDGELFYDASSDELEMYDGTTSTWIVMGSISAVGIGTSDPGSPITGQLFFRSDLLTLRIWNGTAWKNVDSIAQLNDVAISSPTTGDVLTYDGVTGKWKNQAGGGGGGVTSLESLTGALGFTSPDSSINISTSGSDITLEAAGGGGSTAIAGVGTSFPGSPSNGELFIRSDLGHLFGYVSPGTSLQALQVADGASHQYLMDEGSGTTAIDSIGGANGTYNGTAVFVPTLIAGQTYAMVFDGSTTYLTTGATDPNGTGSFTVEIVLTNVSGGWNQRCIANDHTDSNGDGFQVRVGSMGVQFGVDSSNIQGGTIVSAVNYLIHALYNHSTGTISFYVNGVLIASASAGAYVGAGFPITVGRNPAYSGDYWQGTAQDLAIYPSLLTGTQMSNHAAAAAAGWIQL